MNINMTSLATAPRRSFEEAQSRKQTLLCLRYPVAAQNQGDHVAGQLVSGQSLQELHMATHHPAGAIPQ